MEKLKWPFINRKKQAEDAQKPTDYPDSVSGTNSVGKGELLGKNPARDVNKDIQDSVQALKLKNTARDVNKDIQQSEQAMKPKNILIPKKIPSITQRNIADINKRNFIKKGILGLIAGIGIAAFSKTAQARYFFSDGSSQSSSYTDAKAVTATKAGVKLNELQAPDGAVAFNNQKASGLAAAAAQNDAIVADANVRAPDSTLLEGSSKATVQDHTPKAHTVASHSDTTGTGAELNTLTGGSETTLHSHAAAGATLVVAQSQVFYGFYPTSWIDLSLSSVVGSQATLVVLKVFGREALHSFAFRRNGDTDEHYGEGSNSASNAELTSGTFGLVVVETDSTGKVEFKTSEGGNPNSTVDVVAYIK